MFQNLPKLKIPVSKHDKDHASIHWFMWWPELLEVCITNRESLGYFQVLGTFPEPGNDPDWLTKLWDHGCQWWKEVECEHISCFFGASIMLGFHQKQVVSPWSLMDTVNNLAFYFSKFHSIFFSFTV